MRGLSRQTFKDFETIVVDGGSKDGTAQFAGRFAKVIVYTKKGMSVARNKGASASRRERSSFSSMPTLSRLPRLLETYDRIFSDANVVAATGPIYPLEKSKLTMRLGYKFVSV